MYPPLSYRAVKFIVSYHPELVSNTVISLKMSTLQNQIYMCIFSSTLQWPLLFNNTLSHICNIFWHWWPKSSCLFLSVPNLFTSNSINGCFFLLFSRKNVKIISGSLARNHLGNYSCVVPMHSSQSVAPMSRVR